MPPRIQTLQGLNGLSLCLRPATKQTPKFLPAIQTANLSMREKKKKQKKDPYAWAQAQQRKNANLQRKGEIAKEKEGEWGNPVVGKVTPFIESLDSAGQAPTSNVRRDADGNPLEEVRELPQAIGLRNHYLTEEELEDVAKHAFNLTKPSMGVVESQMEDTSLEELNEAHLEKHARATEALRRITSMENASGKDRHHANVRRLVSEFGRHNTDKFLQPKAPSINPDTEERPDRAGPDTGSSEVQIAILTSKIRALSQALETNRGYKDKHNQRNLRLLVHRRQKLLKYMERKERGSERWTHMLEKLGLTPASWKGEITV
ncbi:unnamed protein product [Clonostachys solani]|uniref:30S ribosomal protein S15 n=1 Tax=Clonostachys solani TaxID=160281 RepID=A0A9N9YU52_9HYPO|nr:unnamed protein product [Clonostachys solani]